MTGSRSQHSINIGIGIGCGILIAASGFIVRTATTSYQTATRGGFQSVEQLIQSCPGQPLELTEDPAFARLPELTPDSPSAQSSQPNPEKTDRPSEALLRPQAGTENQETAGKTDQRPETENDSDILQTIATVDPANGSPNPAIPPATLEHDNDFQPHGLPVASGPAMRSSSPETSVFIVSTESPTAAVEGPGIQPQVRRVLSESAAIGSVQSIEAGKSLARAGTFAEAEQHFLAALRILAADHDRNTRSDLYTRTLERGVTALNEIRNFASVSHSGEVNPDLQSIQPWHPSNGPASGKLPALNATDSMEIHANFAQQQLELGAGHNVVSAEALYCLGKLMTAQSLSHPPNGDLLARKAMVFHQAALACDPRNYRSAHELGVLLADLGNLAQSESLLRQSLEIQPTASGWKNLARLHQRMQEPRQAELAFAEARRLAQAEATVEAGDEGSLLKLKIPAGVSSGPAESSQFGSSSNRPELEILQTAGNWPVNPGANHKINSSKESSKSRHRFWPGRWELR